MSVSAGVAVTSITISGNTVTVNATAHGLSAKQGFSLQGVNPSGLNINATVATATANSFTFTMTSPPAWISGGTIFPAKQVVVLSISAQPGGNQVSYLLWLTTLNPVPNSSLSSRFPNVSAQEVTAIQAGTTIEVGRNAFFPSSLSEATIEAYAAADFAGQQAVLEAAIQPGQFLGVYYDGTGWSG